MPPPLSPAQTIAGHLRNLEQNLPMDDRMKNPEVPQVARIRVMNLVSWQQQPQQLCREAISWACLAAVCNRGYRGPYDSGLQLA